MSRQLLKLMPLDGFKNIPAYLDGMHIIFSQVISHPGDHGMYLGSTQFFGRHLFTGSCFDQWWPPNEYGSLVPNNNGFIAHRRNISASG
jgi:hypothetical protein